MYRLFRRRAVFHILLLLAGLVLVQSAAISVDTQNAPISAPPPLPLAPEISWSNYIFSFKFLAEIFIVSSPLTSYIDTILSIYHKQSAQGFSLDLCGIMLVASILRVAFYFGEPFEFSLLLQAVLMIGVQIVVLGLGLYYRAAAPEYAYNGPDGRRKSISEIVYNLRPQRSVSVLRPSPSLTNISNNTANNSNNTTNDDLIGVARDYTARLLPLLKKASRGFRTIDFSGYGTRPLNLWQWTAPATYWQFLTCFTLALFVLHFLLAWSWCYIQFLGFLGLLIEAVLPLPQILTNAELQSVQGFRLSLMASWLAGDLSKLTYFKYGAGEGLAFQFVVCTLIRLALDLFVGLQFLFYSFVLPLFVDETKDSVTELNTIEVKRFGFTNATHNVGNINTTTNANNITVNTKTRQRSHSIKL
jgi:hypothetical protein